MAHPLPRVAERDTDGKRPGVDALVRRLVNDLDSVDQRTGDQGLGRAEWVILDVEVDGVRCLLLRVPESQAPLSPRELEILRLLANGQSNTDIAAQLFLSEGTVRNYVSGLFLPHALVLRRRATRAGFRGMRNESTSCCRRKRRTR